MFRTISHSTSSGVLLEEVRTASFSDHLLKKNKPHIRVLAGFVGARLDKVGGKKQLGLKGFTGH
jgi:hypothetical protein